jgi:hypothetical protein
MAGSEDSDTRTLLRWTIAAVLGSWALNLMTFWVAQAQHQDAKELLQVQVGATLDEEFNSRALRHERSRLALAIDRKEQLEDYRVLRFFDKVGMYMHQGRVDEDTVYQQFARPVEYYWVVCEASVQEQRKAHHDDLLYANFEDLYRQISRKEALSRGGRAPEHTDEEVGHFLDEERALDDIPATAVAGT